MAGDEPIRESLTLTLGADFVHRYRPAVGETIPDGTTAYIALYPKGQKNTLTSIAEWSAVLVDSDAIEFRVESEDADEIPDKAHYRLYVVYPDTPTLDQCWYVGEVRRIQ
ncbi:LtfC-like domain-containing protein [Nocardia sp. NPDC001965]